MRARTSCALGLVLAAALAAAPGRAEDTQAPQAEAVRAVEPPEDLPFDAVERRDPFRPPRASNTSRSGEPRTPLQRYELGQLRLVAVIYDTREPRAVVEDDAGLGYIVKVGTPIGPNGGEVQTIERGRVLIQEDTVDYYGESHPSSVVMELRTADRGKR